MFTGDGEITGQTTSGGVRTRGADAAGRRSAATPGSAATTESTHAARASEAAGAVALDSVQHALADIADGRPVVVVDDADRENEGDIIFAAEKATPELVAFTVRYTSGFLCAPLTGEDCDRLGLPPMYSSNEDPHHTAYTVTVDARDGTTTGISAHDRSATARMLADPDASAADFTRPGHMVPLRAQHGGVLERRGHTEAAIDLARLAGLHPAGVVCEVVSEDDPRTMARTPELRAFADAHGLALISIADLAAWRRTHETLVERGPTADIPTAHGPFSAVGYVGTVDGREHVALVANAGAGPATRSADDPVPVRIHSECLTGDIFGSMHCGCGHDLASAMDAVAAEGDGMVIYLRGNGARGEGLAHTLRSFGLSEAEPGRGASPDPTPPPTPEDLDLAAQILADLGVRSVRLLTCAADASTLATSGKAALASQGITVAGQRSVVRAAEEVPAASAASA